MPRPSRAATEKQSARQRQAVAQALKERALRQWDAIVRSAKRVGKREYEIDPVLMSCALAAHDRAMEHMRQGVMA